MRINIYIYTHMYIQFIYIYIPLYLQRHPWPWLMLSGLFCHDVRDNCLGRGNSITILFLQHIILYTWWTYVYTRLRDKVHLHLVTSGCKCKEYSTVVEIIVLNEDNWVKLGHLSLISDRCVKHLKLCSTSDRGSPDYKPIIVVFNCNASQGLRAL